MFDLRMCKIKISLCVVLWHFKGNFTLGLPRQYSCKVWGIFDDDAPCFAFSHPCSSNTCMHTTPPPHTAHRQHRGSSVWQWRMALATRDAAVCFAFVGQDSLSSFPPPSLSHFNSMYVRLSLSLPSSSHLLISPRLVASSPPAGVKEAKKRS